MNNAAWRCGVAVLLGLGLAAARAADDKPPASPWEYKAVQISDNVGTATKQLNELAADGWDYVGPLGNGLVAFRRTPVDNVARKQIDRLQGTWTTVTSESDGQINREDRRVEKWTINGGRWSVKLDGEVTQEGTYKIVEAGDKLVKVDFVVTDGYKQGDTWSAVYQLDGDKLKMNGCYLSESKVRAKSLTTRDGDGYYVRTMRKEK
jgi:uncharacterized protein (TIGR03067 family)